MWQLYIAVDRRGLEIMAYNSLEDHSLITADIEVGGDYAPKKIEDAVYDNPLLLNEFRHVTVILRSEPSTLIPNEIASEGALTEKIVGEMTGKVDTDILVDHIPLLDMSVAYAPDSELLNFLRRTFTGVSIRHRLSAIIQYWHATTRAMRPLATNVNLHGDRLDIASFSGDRLMFANSFDAATVADRLYYIMAVREMLQVGQDVPVVISGDRAGRDELTSILSRYVRRVLPAVFPAAMFKAGGHTAMNTPLDLVVLPLCE